MNVEIKAILESKQRERQRLAALTFSEKVPLLEKLRDRALAIAGSSLYQEHHPCDERIQLLRERK